MRLVITADDLGMSPGVTSGVLSAHCDGVVRSASLLVTYPASAEGAALARERAPDLELGLHFDLVGGTPASDPARVPSLIDEDGRFLGLGALARALYSGRVRGSEIAHELRAQVARAQEWGITTDAWDSHRHTHALPLVSRVVGALAREHKVRWLRRPTARWGGGKARALRAATFATLPFFRGIPGNEWYVDLSSSSLDAAGIALLAAHGGVGELGVHPGAEDAEGISRIRELTTLTDPLLVAAIGRDTVSRRVG
ncbi:MAG: ChbG/HpnK family deacetylase [Chloroflexi bacterium]|nr:ChbG/HpnK family deacetylase [Chloroflexota bacterium]